MNKTKSLPPQSYNAKGNTENKQENKYTIQFQVDISVLQEKTQWAELKIQNWDTSTFEFWEEKKQDSD